MASAEPQARNTTLNTQASARSLIPRRHRINQSATEEQQDGTAPVPPEVQPNTEGAAKLEGFRLYAVAIGVFFGSLMMSMDISIIGTAIPSILSEFGDISQLAWYPAAYTFAGCALTPLAGKMAAVFPLDRVYLSFSGIFLVGSIVCGWAPSSNAFIAGRAVAGIGAAGVASNGMTILVTISSFKTKTLLVGLAVACFGIGLVLGPVLGGVFTERLTWRWCFWINLPFVAVTLTVIFLFFKPPRKPQRSIVTSVLSLDLLGCILFVGAVFMLLLAMQQGGQNNPWNSATIIGLFVGAGVTMILFVAWEWYKGDDAMIPGRVTTRRTVVFTCLFVFFHMGSLTISTYYLPEWFQVVEGVDPLQSGVRMLPTVITQIIATSVASRLAWRFKYYNIWFFLAPIFMVTSSALYTTFTAFDTPEGHWIGFQIIQGFGAGFGMQMSSLTVQLELMNTPDLVPVGISLVTFSQFLGSSVLQVIAGTVFNNQLFQELLTHAGLTVSQVRLLLAGEITNVRNIAQENFPGKLDIILESYNNAITSVFFVPIAGTALAFFLAFGIKWNRIPDSDEPNNNPQALEGNSEGGRASPVSWREGRGIALKDLPPRDRMNEREPSAAPSTDYEGPDGIRIRSHTPV